MKCYYKSLLLLSMVLIPLGAMAWFGNGDLQYVYARASVGDVYGLKRYASRGGNLNIQDRSGNTAYCLALKLNNQTAVRTLALAGANTHADCMTRLGIVTESMIYSAADSTDTQQLSFWQRHGVSMDIMDEDGNTALCEAVYKHNCPAIDTLLKAGASQYHSCFNRIPIEVRRSLNCKEVVRDWSKFGMTLLGAGLVGGIAYAAANGGGGGGSLSCGDGEHWNGKECVLCLKNEYWDKKSLTCVSCETGSFAAVGATSCTTCPEKNTKFDYTTGTCVECPDFSESDGYTDTCTACGANQIWKDERCTDCGEGLAPTSDRTSCDTCHANYYYDSTERTCRECPDATPYSKGGIIGVNQCVSCESGTTWDTTLLQCVCNTGAGYCLDESADPPTCRLPRGVKYTGTSDPGEYIDPLTGKCMPIAPQATSEADFNTILATYNTGGTHYTEYTASNALDPINAKYAYARGYTGKIINRLKNADGSYDDFGSLGEGEAITDQRIKVGIIGTGQVTSDLTGGITTGYQYPSTTAAGEVDIWDSYTTSTKYYTNPDLTANTGSQFNFDRGVCATSSSTNCYTKVLSGSTWLLVYKDASGNTSLVNKENYEFENYTSLSGIDASDYVAFTDLFNQYAYFSGYDLSETNYKNATPHYLINLVRITDTSDPSGTRITSGSLPQDGTQLSALVGAAQDDNGIMGVAFDVTLIPVVSDTVHPLQNGYKGENAVKTLVDAGASVILQTVYREVDKKEGSVPVHTVADIDDSETMDTYYYDSAVKAYDKLAESNSNAVLVVPTGYFEDNNEKSEDGSKIEEIVISEPTIDAGAPLTSDGDDLLGHFVSVTAVEPYTYTESGTTKTRWALSSDALPCGSTGNYCLSAPGNVSATISPSTSGTYSVQDYSGSSTSAAAAVVAGAIAIMQGAYPHLSSSEIMEILYRTATPIGALDSSQTVTDYSDEVKTGTYGSYSTLYGYGLINLEEATRPQGPLWVHNGFDTSGNAKQMPYISTSSAVSSPAASFNLKYIPITFSAFDSYGREFTVSLSSAFSSLSSNRHDFEDEFKAFMNGREVSVSSPNDRFTMTYAPRYSSRSSAIPNGLMDLQMNFGELTTKMFYSEDTLMQGNYFEHVLNNPLTQFQEAYGFGSTYNLNKNWSIGATYMAGKNGFYGDGDKDFEAPDNKMDAFSVELAYKPSKSVLFKTSYGLMREDDSVLGMIGEGNFALNGASTAFVGAGVSLRPTDKLKLDLMYTYGWTTPESTDGLMRLSHLTADGFALTAQYQFNENQMFGLSFSSPLRVNSGKVSLALPVGRATDSNTFYSQIYSAPLKPDAREYDISLFYKDKLTEDLSIQSELGLRLNPDHQSDAKTDYRGMLGLKYKY